jgi:hypothetical protein
LQTVFVGPHFCITKLYLNRVTKVGVLQTGMGVAMEAEEWGRGVVWVLVLAVILVG